MRASLKNVQESALSLQYLIDMTSFPITMICSVNRSKIFCSELLEEKKGTEVAHVVRLYRNVFLSCVHEKTNVNKFNFRYCCDGLRGHTQSQEKWIRCVSTLNFVEESQRNRAFVAV
jgi:hypothetical protein